jgi:hypothetical protein
MCLDRKNKNGARVVRPSLVPEPSPGVSAREYAGRHGRMLVGRRHDQHCTSPSRALKDRQSRGGDSELDGELSVVLLEKQQGKWMIWITPPLQISIVYAC